MKPYQTVPIQECGELLVAIPLDEFAVETPHPYEKLGAPYGVRSPYFLRQSVLERLHAAQKNLQSLHPGWRIQIFDAYRPVAVQQFMVEYTLQQVVRSHYTAEHSPAPDPQTLSETERQAFLQQVYQFWAVPNLDPKTPPPHSTGAALDVTLVDADEQPVDMGSPIDELSPRSYPDYFAPTSAVAIAPEPIQGVPQFQTRHEFELVDSREPNAQYHHHRQLLLRVMASAGFHRHPREWWHFSYGDQLWAWLSNEAGSPAFCYARYGRVEE